MKKKLLSVVLALLLVMGAMPALAGCGTRNDGLSVMLMVNSSENAFYEEHFEKMEAELGININYTPVAYADYYTRLQAEMQGGTIPDIFYIRPSDIKSFIDDGMVADITSELTSQTDVDLSKIYESALSSYRYDKASKTMGTGAYYAVPKDLSVQQLGYNKTLIERKRQAIENADLKVPWEMDWETENYTWDEYKQMAAIMTDTSDTRNPVYGCDIPNIEILTWSFGGSILSDDLQTVQINSEAFKQAVAYQAALIDDGAANYQGATYDNFVAGRVAFYGETNSFDIKAFDETFSSLSMEWDVMPWPVADDTAEPDEWYGKITSAGYAISADCDDKDLAVKVMLSLLTEETQEDLVANRKLMLPIYKDLAEQAYILPENDDMYSPKSRSVYIDVISGKNGKFSIDYSCYNLLWQKNYTDYLETIAASASGSARGKLRGDGQYNTLNDTVQSEYDKIKNR